MREPTRLLVERATAAARCSPCQSKRGVVVFLETYEIIGTGWNAARDCDGGDACRSTCSRVAVHAEQAALLSCDGDTVDADMLHLKIVDGNLVPSGPPSCIECAKLALYAGIAGFWLYHEAGWVRYAMREFYDLSLVNARPR